MPARTQPVQPVDADLADPPRNGCHAIVTEMAAPLTRVPMVLPPHRKPPFWASKTPYKPPLWRFGGKYPHKPKTAPPGRQNQPQTALALSAHVLLVPGIVSGSPFLLLLLLWLLVLSQCIVETVGELVGQHLSQCLTTMGHMVPDVPHDLPSLLAA